jgi:type II secretory pathway component PulJ
MKTQIKPRKAWRTGSLNLSSQAGATLIELMIGLALSLIVTTSMVILMANSFGIATRIIHMSQLSDELRNSMSMMTRDLRRANYSAHSLFCYGNSACGDPGGSAPQVGDVYKDPVRDCFSFTLDRNSDGNAANDSVAGFQRIVKSDVGVIEMWISTAADADPCANEDGDGWIELTDPNTINITAFEIDEPFPFEQVYEEGETNSFTNRQRQVQIRLAGSLVLEEAKGINMVTREIQDTIYARNDFITSTP